jgi:putative chitinase
MINRKLFFEAINKSLFQGKLTPDKQKAIAPFLDYWEAELGYQDLKWLAYVLATTYHETARTFLPIDEFGKGHGRRYGVPDPETGQTYFGRGMVQLTWRANYEKFGKLLKVDLVNHPELALKPEYAIKIIFIGMEKGLFTGKKLSDYLNKISNNWYNARRIINSSDCAAKIADYGKAFYEALKGAIVNETTQKPTGRI